MSTTAQGPCRSPDPLMLKIMLLLVSRIGLFVIALSYHLLVISSASNRLLSVFSLSQRVPRFSLISLYNILKY